MSPSLSVFIERFDNEEESDLVEDRNLCHNPPELCSDVELMILALNDRSNRLRLRLELFSYCIDILIIRRCYLDISDKHMITT